MKHKENIIDMIRRLTPEYRKGDIPKNLTSNIQVLYDDNLEDWDSTARRPYYRLRGQSITEEQAFDIISKTDRVLDNVRLNDGTYLSDKIDIYFTFNLQNRWFIKNIFPKFNGWCKPDGTIGCNGLTGKYPDLKELLWDIQGISSRFPYLNFVWAITDWDEVPDYIWDDVDDKLVDIKYREDFKDFIEHIEILFYVHDNTIEILQGDEAKQKYLEYESKYEKDSLVFTEYYYENSGIQPASIEYLERILAIYGLKQEEVEFLYDIISE